MKELRRQGRSLLGTALQWTGCFHHSFLSVTSTTCKGSTSLPLTTPTAILRHLLASDLNSKRASHFNLRPCREAAGRRGQGRS